MRRIMMLMTVVALMVVMTAMTVAPAFAHTPSYFGCGDKGAVGVFPAGAYGDRNGDGVVCGSMKKDGTYKDNHVHR